MIGKKRVKEGLHKQKKSQLHTERGGQGKSSENQKSAERGREREKGEKKTICLQYWSGRSKKEK